jgi:hypothetical protein
MWGRLSTCGGLSIRLPRVIPHVAPKKALPRGHPKADSGALWAPPQIDNLPRNAPDDSGVAISDFGL